MQVKNTEIKAGDIVRVVDWGRNHSTCSDWFLKRVNKLKLEWLMRYAYGDSENYEKYPEKGSDNRLWEVLFVDDGLALITRRPEYFKGVVYLIELKALAPATREMTLFEIEAELGYPVKIVKEK